MLGYRLIVLFINPKLLLNVESLFGLGKKFQLVDLSLKSNQFV